MGCKLAEAQRVACVREKFEWNVNIGLLLVSAYAHPQECWFAWCVAAWYRMPEFIKLIAVAASLYSTQYPTPQGCILKLQWMGGARPSLTACIAMRAQSAALKPVPTKNSTTRGLYEMACHTPG